MSISVDRDRMLSEIETLASFSDAEAPAVTRVVFTPTDLKARAWIRARCEEAGLTVRHDAIGNVFARWQGSDPSAPVVGTGSHIDAIANAGKYDGVVGVLGGLEAIRALQQSGFRPTHSIELLIFTSEEPTRFGIGCLGSRLLSGTLATDEARKLSDKHEHSLDQVRLQGLLRTSHRTRTAARTPANSSRHRYEDRRPGEFAYFDCRLGRARRRSLDAGPSRCLVRGSRVDSGDRKCRTPHRGHRFRYHRRHLRGISGRSEQHSQQSQLEPRCARHRS
jgi:hypothetical protein